MKYGQRAINSLAFHVDSCGLLVGYSFTAFVMNIRKIKVVLTSEGPNTLYTKHQRAKAQSPHFRS
jgi:hypothetical protein